MTGRAYRLTERAEQDIIEIYLEGLNRFGVQQADRYHHELNSLTCH
jgi:plasmid stabilization system protein ParE